MKMEASIFGFWFSARKKPHGDRVVKSNTVILDKLPADWQIPGVRTTKIKSVSFPPKLLRIALRRAWKLGVPFSTYLQTLVKNDAHTAKPENPA